MLSLSDSQCLHSTIKEASLLANWNQLRYFHKSSEKSTNLQLLVTSLLLTSVVGYLSPSVLATVERVFAACSFIVHEEPWRQDTAKLEIS